MMMIFSKKNAGKWVASKNEKVVATSKNLKVLLKKVEKRDDRKKLWFDLVPKGPFIGTSYGIRLP